MQLANQNIIAMSSDVDEKSILNIEKFFSPQGEGVSTIGKPTVWLRTWGCTNKCRGFGASDPTDESTYDEYTEVYDPREEDVSVVQDLPVFKTGCDSRHTWDPRYRFLAKKETVSDIADQLEELMKNEFNPDGKFINPHSGKHNHFAITGGEPMMHQDGIIALLMEFGRRGNAPRYITIETNCTVSMTPEFREFVTSTKYLDQIVWTFSCSPKLETVSGDDPSIAHKVGVVRQYYRTGCNGYLKIVVRGEQRVWDELESRMVEYRRLGIIWDLVVMPVGSDVNGQQLNAGDVANQACARGYQVTPRAHVQWFGNEHCT